MSLSPKDPFYLIAHQSCIFLWMNLLLQYENIICLLFTVVGHRSRHFRRYGQPVFPLMYFGLEKFH